MRRSPAKKNDTTVDVPTGTRVRVRPKSLKNSLGIDHILQGGEGFIARISEDLVGPVIYVRLAHTRKVRAVRRKDLTVCRVQQIRSQRLRRKHAQAN